jgi:hypothetical protein
MQSSAINISGTPFEDGSSKQEAAWRVTFEKEL